MGGKYSREDCIALLKEKSASLASEGADRYPQRSDFTQEEVVAIKSHLGAWPRALEAGGIKDIEAGREELKAEKRIASKRRKTMMKIEKKKL